jgi:hypothetical protein
MDQVLRSELVVWLARVDPEMMQLASCWLVECVEREWEDRSDFIG